MKKIMIIAAASAAVFTSSLALAGGPEIIPIEPDYFNGFFVGGTGSLHHTSFDATSTATLNEPVLVGTSLQVAADLGIVGISVAAARAVEVLGADTFMFDDADGSEYSGYGGVQGGFGKVFNHQWYLGIVGFGDWGSQSDTSNMTSNSSATPTAATLNVNVAVPDIATVDLAAARATQASSTTNSSTTVEIGNDYGVAAKLGYLVAPRTMIYGKIGAIWADIDVSNNVTITGNGSDARGVDLSVTLLGDDPISVLSFSRNAEGSAVVTGSSSGSDTKLSLLLGIGVEQYVYKDMVTINVEYDYANYGTVDTTPGALTVNSASGSVSNNLTVLGVSIPLPTVPLSYAGDGNVGTTQASTSAKVSTILAGLNVYFGSNWI